VPGTPTVVAVGVADETTRRLIRRRCSAKQEYQGDSHRKLVLSSGVGRCQIGVRRAAFLLL
jgi:hypothetical protein